MKAVLISVLIACGVMLAGWVHTFHQLQDATDALYRVRLNTVQHMVIRASYTLQVACMNGDEFTADTACERLRLLSQHGLGGQYGLVNPIHDGGGIGVFPADSTGAQSEFLEFRPELGDIGVWMGHGHYTVFGYGDDGRVVYSRGQSQGPYHYRVYFRPNGTIAMAEKRSVASADTGGQ